MVQDRTKVDNDIFLRGADDVKLRFSFLPRKCRVSGKSIWFKTAYRVRYAVVGWDMDEYYNDRWYSKQEYVMLVLKA